MLHAEKARREAARRQKRRLDGLARNAREVAEAAAARRAKSAAAVALVSRRRAREAEKHAELIGAVETKHAVADARVAERQMDRDAFWLEAAEAAEMDADEHLRRADEVEAARLRELRLRVALKNQRQNERLLTAAAEHQSAVRERRRRRLQGLQGGGPKGVGRGGGL